MPWNTPTPTTTVENEYLLGLGGEQVTVLGQSAAWQWTNVYAGAKQLATYDSAGTHFAVTDWLGSKRLELSATAASTVTVSEQCTSLPFGDSLDCTGSDVNQLHFTGKERDTESGNDYFGARYYASTMGRFLTPDWSKNPQGVPYANYANPQSLNLYVYVGNNPLSLADADGHCTDTTNAPCELMQAAKKNSTAATSQAQQQNGAVQNLVDAQNAAMSNPAMAPNPATGTTHCNQGACSIDRANGGNPNGVLANANGVPYDANTQIHNLANPQNGYHVVTPAEAQGLADKGEKVWATQLGARHGHIASVRPEGVPGDHPRGRSGPILANIGLFNGVAHQSAVFTPAHGAIIYYAPNQ